MVVWISIFSFFIGCFITVNENAGIIGLNGFTNGNFIENSKTDFTIVENVEYDFPKVFGVFFPAGKIYF